jgi:hypothetical protein
MRLDSPSRLLEGAAASIGDLLLLASVNVVAGLLDASAEG